MSKASPRKLSLADWINEVGTGYLAEKLGTTQAAVRHWRRGHCLPRREEMIQIKKLSRGAVTYDAMIEGK